MLASLFGFENRNRTDRVFTLVVNDTQAFAVRALPALANVVQCTPSGEL